jgi:hypothetical protein
VVHQYFDVAVESGTRRLGNGWLQMAPLTVFAIMCVLSLLKQELSSSRWIQWPPAVRFMVLIRFPDAIQIADYIKSQTSPESQVAVLGSEPEILFYAGRRSPTGYIYTYGLMEPQPYASRMQREMAGEIEAAKPEFTLFVGVPTSWLPQVGFDPFILDWAKGYLRQYYDLVGLAEILPKSEYRWGADLKNYQRRSQWSVEVYKRTR